MTTIEQTREPGTPRVRRLASALVLAVGTPFGAILRRSFRRRLAAAGAVAAMSASTMLTAQPVAAAYEHHMVFRYDYVKVTQLSDGCCYDNTLEVYGAVAVHTSTNFHSADNYWSSRNFGTWGKDLCEAAWNSSFVDSECSKKIQVGVWPFSDVHFCKSSWWQSCDGYTYSDNNYIPLSVFAGDKITFDVHMKDYDSASADDEVCTGSLTIGPFTDDQLWAFSGLNPGGRTLNMPWNGNAACQVHVTFYD